MNSFVFVGIYNLDWTVSISFTFSLFFLVVMIVFWNFLYILLLELPIHSAIGTSSYKLAKFLIRKLSSVTYNEFTVKDYFASAEEIVHQDSKLFMYSLDFDSLFTYIPLEEIINIGTNLLYNNEDVIEDRINLSLRTFCRWLLKNCISYLTVLFIDKRMAWPWDRPLHLL